MEANENFKYCMKFCMKILKIEITNYGNMETKLRKNENMKKMKI